MKNIIQFKAGFINLPITKKGNEKLESLAFTVAAELMQFGYILDRESIEHLSSASKNTIVTFHTEIINWLKKMTGSSRNYVPFWKGFPEEVMEKSESELWLHQIFHYLSNGNYEPNEWTKVRKTAFELPKYTIIKLGNDEKYHQIFTDLVSVNNSLTPDDLEIVKYFVSSGDKLIFPSAISFKENLCTLAAMGLDVPVKSVTDVLRIAVHMSGGDISLPAMPPAKIKLNRWSSVKSKNPERDKFKFKKFSRKERKYLLNLLEKTNCDTREFVLKDGRWIRLGEILHPGEYRKEFPKAFELFDDIRNTKVQSWYGEVDSAFKRFFEEGLSKLSERPGEFIRKLDWLIRTNDEKRKASILKTLSEVSVKASNKVIFESYGHFEKREKPVTGRSIMIKGARNRVSLPDLPSIKKSTIVEIQEILKDSLSKKFASLEPLGKVWIDEELRKIPLPTNMRSMSSSLKPVIRGQRIPIGNMDAKVIRAYVHWFDEKGNQDIDLTATYLGEKQIRHIGWNGDKNSDIGCYSGDIRYRRGACAEYIDIVVDEALKKGFKYVIIDARNYTGGSLKEITDCVFGYMERQFPKANEIFVPSTLANSVRLQSTSSTTIVAVIDLETREYIFLDIDQAGIPVASANFNAIMEAIKPYTELPSFSVYDLLLIHSNSRGEIVDNKEDAETVYDFETFSSSYIEIMKMMGI